MSTGTWELGKVCILLNNKPGIEDRINELATEAADRISTTPEAKAKLHALFHWYMTKAVEASKE